MRRTRLQQMRVDMKDEGFEPPMPPIDAGAHVLGYLMEIGPVMPGPAAISHQELRCWQDNTGVVLEPWQARAIRALSLEYLAEMHRAEAPDATPPWTPDTEGAKATNRAVVASQVDSFMRGLSNPK